MDIIIVYAIYNILAILLICRFKILKTIYEYYVQFLIRLKTSATDDRYCSLFLEVFQHEWVLFIGKNSSNGLYVLLLTSYKNQNQFDEYPVCLVYTAWSRLTKAGFARVFFWLFFFIFHVFVLNVLIITKRTINFQTFQSDEI